MKKLLTVFVLLFLISTANAQLFIRAHSLSYGIRNKDGDIGWIVEDKPENLLITILKGHVTIYSQKTQHFHLVETIKEEKGLIAYSCKDEDGVNCVVMIISDKDREKCGLFVIEYKNIIYYYYTSLEE